MTDTPFSYMPSQQVRKDLSFGKANWQNAEEQYKQGQYLSAVGSTLTYIDEAIGQKFIKDPEAGVNVPHGSMQMFITVFEGSLRILAPFVDIANAQKLILLRKICEINFLVLSMAKIECKEDTFSFLFSCPLEECEPWKIYDILREICFTADKYDDEFVVMHGASWVYKPIVTDYSQERKDTSWKWFKQGLQEGKQWVTYWKQKGYPYVAWDVIYCTLTKLDHICAPQGSIKNNIESAIERLYDKRDINDLVNDGINRLELLDNLAQGAFFTQLYDASVFIPAKISGSATGVQASLKPYLTDAAAHLQKNEPVSAYLCLQKGIYRLLYNYRFNEAQWQQLEFILSGSTGLSISDAGKKMYDQLNEFYNNPRDQFIAPAPDKKEEKQSLFAGWFS